MRVGSVRISRSGGQERGGNVEIALCDVPGNVHVQAPGTRLFRAARIAIMRAGPPRFYSPQKLDAGRGRILLLSKEISPDERDAAVTRRSSPSNILTGTTSDRTRPSGPHRRGGPGRGAGAETCSAMISAPLRQTPLEAARQRRPEPGGFMGTWGCGCWAMKGLGSCVRRVMMVGP